MPFDSQSTFGSYRLLERLGEGAMGTVWRALDLRLEREVALKVLKGAEDEPGEGTTQRRRSLLAEAKLACQLNHPNIAHIYDAGEVDGVPFIAMELVEGQPLRALVGKPMSASQLLPLARQAASALAHAHHKGIVHRDIKPDNLVLNEDGILKILDFGIARRQGASSAALDQTAHHMTLVSETAPGFSMGTPAYMSPEQANGLALNGASDQFSLGTVLYELATGRHPFLKDNLVETLFAVAKDDPEALSRRRRDLPDACSRGIMRLLSKKPEDRYPELTEFVRALDGQHGSGTVPVLVPVMAPRRKRWPLVAGVAGTLLVVGGGAWWWHLRADHGAPESGLLAARAAASADFINGRKVVAVLPMEQLNAGQDQAWLSTSLADALAFTLVERPDLLVLDRYKVGETMARLGDKPGAAPKSISALGHELRASLLISGSYQITGGRIRVTVRSIDPATGATERQFMVERPESDLTSLEEELQQRAPLDLHLGAAGEARFLAKDPRTREYYTKANQVLLEGNEPSLKVARNLFEGAIQIEPSYAPAHAGLAWTLEELAATSALTQGRFQESQAMFKQAKEEAEKALQMDPSIGLGYRALSATLLRSGDVDGACKAGLEALRLDPADYRAYDVLADAFAGLDGADNHAAARRYYEKSLALYPDNWYAHHRISVLLQNDGELEESLQHAMQAAALKPSAEFAHVTAVDDLLWLGRLKEAEAQIQAGLQELPSSTVLRSLQAYTRWEMGDSDGARAVIRDLDGAWPEGSSNAALLDGLSRDLQGDTGAMADLFAGYAARIRQEGLASRKHNERRVISVNLYFMADALMHRGRKPAALDLIKLADELHPGKAQVVKMDPRFA
ncbi:MAG: protein kinase [Acidobacteria bacterium]|nr:protein kinase [Acidobacteriota bacterium]